jgi:hypothetical protein
MKGQEFRGGRIFKDEAAAKAYLHGQGFSEEQIAQMHFLPAQKLPLSFRRKMILDESMRQKTTRNARRKMRRLAARG